MSSRCFSFVMTPFSAAFLLLPRTRVHFRLCCCLRKCDMSFQQGTPISIRLANGLALHKHLLGLNTYICITCLFCSVYFLCFSAFWGERLFLSDDSLSFWSFPRTSS